MQENISKKRNIIVIAVILLIIVAAFGLSAYSRYNTQKQKESEAEAEPQLQVVVQYVDREIFRAPLDKDAMYMIKDGVVSEVPMDTTLESMGDEALETKHHINLMQVKDNAVSVVQSNCSNQVCVSIGKISGSNYDFPITCLPHGLIIVVE
ncbi:NusG domain II-containing protein [Oribacterium sp. WCC10]|uniref:NusG domain II-containing protein n=1 Tax=Oribacterium sp. WCC10 TaxID=1855343 RepID=UPI0008E8C5F0|nr:NusG domain II-containing protein [Oribacterium sp. WCC10]SFG42788.1 NusG domain II [Oribacterium sp. WCC10]